MAKKKKESVPDRLFYNVDLASDVSDAFSHGFHMRESYPKHQLMDIVQGEENYLYLLYLGEEPTSTEIIQMLEKHVEESKDDEYELDMYTEFLNLYKEEVSDEMNYEMDRMLAAN